MEIAELFPSWEEHEVRFFEKHLLAITTVAHFMAGFAGWETLVMIEKINRNCAPNRDS